MGREPVLHFVVCLESLPYPFGGYRLTAKQVPKSHEHIWDWLSPHVVKHVFVEAKNVKQAKAVGLKELVEEAKDAKKPCPICLSTNSNPCVEANIDLCPSADIACPAKGNKIMLKGGRIVEVPEEYRTAEEIFNWLKSNYGKAADFLVSELNVYIPEIDEYVHFLESNDGMLVSTTTFPKKAFRKLKNKYPFIEPAYIKASE